MSGDGDILRQPVVGHLGAVVDSGTFGIEPLPLDAVEMQHRGMGGKARPDRRARVGFRPVDDVGEILPERLLGQRRGVRLGAGHDQSIDLQPAEIGDIGVLPFDPPLRGLRSAHRRQREAVEVDASVAGGRSQQTHELALGRLQRGIRHVVDEPDREHRIGGILRTVEVIASRGCAGARPGLTISRCLSNRRVMPGPAIYSAASSR